MGNVENKLRVEDSSIHDWYRFVLSFPPHLVQQYLKTFCVDQASFVLDPFCGTGTTNVECKKHGISSWGIEASPLTHFVSRTKCRMGERYFRFFERSKTDCTGSDTDDKFIIKTDDTFR